MNTATVFQAAKVVARIESLVPCFQRTETKNGEPLSDATLSFNKSVADTLQQAAAVIEAMLTNQ